MAILNSNALLQGSIEFINNSASQSGGGLSSILSQVVTNTSKLNFIGNVAGGGGAGIFMAFNNRIQISSANFIDNRAASGGAITTNGEEEMLLHDITCIGNTGVQLTL